MKFLNLKHRTAYAHCDVPCGIYDPSSAQQAALSVIRFLDLITELNDQTLDASNWVSNVARLSRLVEQKEVHAQAVKNEINIIWGDYIKSAQIEKFPEIHSLTHQIMQTASACKQETKQSNGVDLLNLVNRFAEIFWATKEVATQKVTVPYAPKKEIIQAILTP